MPTLTFKNQELASFVSVRDMTSITNDLIYGSARIPPEDISALNSDITFLYSSNELVINLDSLPSEEAPVAADAPRPALFASPATIKISSFWNIEPTADVHDSSNYRLFESSFEIVSSSPNQISIKLRADEQARVSESFRSLGIDKPSYGLLLVVLTFTDGFNNFESSYLMKYTHSPLFSSPVINEDLFGATRDSIYNRYTSPGYSGETIYIPKLSCSFVYNFYEKEELDYLLYRSRDYKGKNLLDMPKYIKLKWDVPVFNVDEFNRENVPLSLPASIPAENRDRVLDPLDGITRAGIRDAIASAGSSPSIADPPPAPPPNRYETLLRFGGLIVSTPTIREELAAAFSAAPRVSDSAASIFDREAGASPLESDAAGIDPSVIPSPTEYEDLIARDSDYVGYVIEKFRVAEDGVELELVDLIAIPGKTTTEYIDTKIAYGEVYSYKIRSVFRFVNNYHLTMYSDSDSLLDKTQTISYVDTNLGIQTRKTYYFDSSNSDACEVQCVESRRPDPPQSVKIFPQSRSKKIFVTWSQKSQNRDVVGFNLYRKLISENSFIKLNSNLIDIRNNFYVDYDLIQDSEYVYAVEAVDVHGNFSKLSAQYAAKIILYTNFDGDVCESPTRIVHREGLELGEVEESQQDELILIKSRLAININPLFKNTDENNTFLIKVTSLDTGIAKEFKVNFRTQTIYHVDPYVPVRRFNPEAVDTERERTALERLFGGASSLRRFL